ncbi:ABC transporter ATP-binding protein [Bacillus sp. TS-2]|nr:ABC transporter ATP-binding protein [Bacillus sp. TS-2]
MNSIIKVENLVKKYRDFIAVDHVTFEIEEGSIFAFLGPNGAGKSTTIHTLCTILDKTSGTILIQGKDVSKQKEEIRQLIGVVFQDSTLDPKMTVEENLKMHGHFYDVPQKEMSKRIDMTLELVDLIGRKKSPIQSLSGGMKRRVEIARSLLHEPKILFLDEPTTGLDPQTRSKIWSYLTDLQKKKKLTIFFTTHYIEEAEISHKVAIMDNGRIIAFDSPKSLKKQYTKDQIYLTTMQQNSLERQLKLQEIPYRKLSDGYYKIEFEPIKGFLKWLQEHSNLYKDLEIRKGTLNDVFLEITGREMRG